MKHVVLCAAARGGRSWFFASMHLKTGTLSRFAQARPARTKTSRSSPSHSTTLTFVRSLIAVQTPHVVCTRTAHTRSEELQVRAYFRGAHKAGMKSDLYNTAMQGELRSGRTVDHLCAQVALKENTISLACRCEIRQHRSGTRWSQKLAIERFFLTFNLPFLFTFRPNLDSSTTLPVAALLTYPGSQTCLEVATLQ